MTRFLYIQSFVFIFFSLFILASGVYFEDKPCQNDPNVNCTIFKDLCGNETYIPLLRDSCPVYCNLCPSTASPTTVVPCVDDKNTTCSDFTGYCNNEKYIPLMKQYCPVTCNLCPGATTVAPPTPNPNCYDSSTKCKEWKKNGYCEQCFYSCAERTRYCAKTCGFCTKGACKDCK